MGLKPRYFGYNDQYGKWVELGGEPTTVELKSYREVEVFYTAYQVERALGNYRSFFEEVGKRIAVLPEWLQKFYFDMQRRIEHEYQTGNRKQVSTSATTLGDGKSR